MLTRDLLIFRKYKDTVRPSFLDTKQTELQTLAADLLDIFQRGVGERRGDLEEALDARTNAHAKPRVAKGLSKLLMDRAEFEEADETVAAARAEAFARAAAVLREQVQDDTPLDRYLELVAASLAEHEQTAGPLDATRERLYNDLAANRRLIRHRAYKPLELLHRYNLALVQGLVLHSRGVTVTALEPDLLELRQVLRRLKFSRLVADVRREGQHWVLQVEGPGAILDMQKKYGLQLATFVTAVPLLKAFRLDAVIELPRRGPLKLSLSNKDPLVTIERAGLGHVPPEIEQIKQSFDDERWVLDLAPEIRHVGTTGMCVPDFSLRPGAPAELELDAPPPAPLPTIAIELFHRWHRHALTRRLDELERFPDGELYLGVERALLKDAAVAARVESLPNAFVFNRFPARRTLRALVRELERQAE
ncbi:MAG: DUF790 family protein [Myxococcales bacterium]|nr:DUF790 family protein [Myxococcales bacterium]MCB9751964.1 DUF790 family protein [Myxococcales bacterium]